MKPRSCVGHTVTAALASLVAFAAPASAQDWPARNITVIVPLGAGSASDIIARVVMEQVGRQVGQSVVVENHPGRAARSAPTWSRRHRPRATRS